MKLNLDYLIATLKELVRIPSPPGGEGEVAEVVASKLDGLEVEVDEYFNVIAEVGEGRPSILLNAHLDTVPPGEGWSVDPYSAVVKDGKIYGRGASDNKAGVASMIAIAKTLSMEKLEGKLVLLFTSREEGRGKLEARRGLVGEIGADAGICLDYYIDAEAGRCEVAVGCRGIANIEVLVKGRAWHASEPELGVNAIYRACDFIKELRSIRLRWMDGPLTMEESVSVTMMEGGEWPTMIPDLCKLNVNFRLLPHLSVKSTVVRIKEVAERSLKEDFKVKLRNGSKGYLIDTSSPIVKAALEAAASVGLKGELAIAKGWLDAAQLHRMFKIPIVCIGTATGGQAHLKDEYVKIIDVAKGADVALNTIVRFLKASTSFRTS